MVVDGGMSGDGGGLWTARPDATGRPTDDNGLPGWRWGRRTEKLAEGGVEEVAVVGWRGGTVAAGLDCGRNGRLQW